jgi:hypothetical protein
MTTGSGGTTMEASSKTTFQRLLALCLLFLFLTSAACEYLPFGFTPIKDIVNNPAQYENREVKVKGVVSQVTKLPFLEIKLYILTEDNYQIPVLTRGTLPPAESRVVVTGVVENVAIVGNESVGLHLRETKRLDGV